MEDFNTVDILLVEDNPHDAELTLRALQRNSLAKNVLVVRDGEEALDFFFCRGKFQMRNISKPPKVVFLDLKLPKVSGLEVLKIVKGDKRTSHIPVVAVTSSREESDIKNAYSLGVNSYITKPVDFDQFINSLSSAGSYWLNVNEILR